MTFRNYTPHAITLLPAPAPSAPGSGQFTDEGTTHEQSFPSVGIARVSVEETEMHRTYGGAVIVRQAFGTVEGLPEPEEGVLLIVSSVVAAALPDRDDLVTPARLVRDGDGRVIGCKALALNW